MLFHFGAVVLSLHLIRFKFKTKLNRFSKRKKVLIRDGSFFLNRLLINHRQLILYNVIGYNLNVIVLIKIKYNIAIRFIKKNIRVIFHMVGFSFATLIPTLTIGPSALIIEGISYI